jgi:hypothetical protein
MADLFGAALLAETKPLDQEGLDIILSMLVVGLIFLGVIALGELKKYFDHRRKARRS